ncbi:MAG: SMC-Scp complex subunit ScpB [Fibrobacter sp.]|jgi:segregation and condensation protein B|uniref:SMC-Scp complex subunit ScpB n=1 Tax=uncultured Fibrobacter sp. TaxID=261512 RepID=UPI0015658B2D|nr:SMC-Scp complex subunit ScpB [uncultured Fibrobacter sp.]MBQ1824386.1 SMC-Scp complex subunit ScpB [Fibrobacter sp.]MBR6317157.1 SMC-Scp complex subunit ScpB [Fibrobacter sp.]
MSEDVQNMDDVAEESAELPKVESREDLARIIQAIVFASPDIVTLKKLREILGDFLDARTVSDALITANDSLNKIQSPFEIVEQAGGYRFRTRAKYYPWVRKLFPEANARRLSQAALETLAVIAYQQPITKAAIEQVRGVSSVDGPIRNLLDKGFVALGARSDTVGNPYTYVTTQEFMKYFGINRIPEDLPRLREFSELLEAGALVPQYARPENTQEEPKPPEETPDQIELSMGDA